MRVIIVISVLLLVLMGGIAGISCGGGSSAFIQTGGTNNTNDLYIHSPYGNARYSLSGGNLNASNEKIS